MSMFYRAIGTIVIVMLPIISAGFFHLRDRRYADGKHGRIRTLGGTLNVYRWAQYSSVIIAVASLFCRHWLLLQLYNSSILPTCFGLSVSLAAIALYIWAKLRLGAQYSPCSDSWVANQLVATGPYAYIRHPIYVAILAWLLGIFIATGSVWIIMNFALLAFYYRVSAREEEDALAKELPGYGEYMARTGAFLPRLH
jgi:protein-S-isoprenylcysteine O-methyltransferase Ste14